MVVINAGGRRRVRPTNRHIIYLAGVWLALAISRAGKREIDQLLQKNQEVSLEREKREAEAAMLAVEKRASERRQLELSEANVRLEQESAEVQRRRVESLLRSVNQAVAGDLGAVIDVRGADSLGKVGQGLA